MAVHLEVQLGLRWAEIMVVAGEAEELLVVVVAEEEVEQAVEIGAGAVGGWVVEALVGI